VVVDEIAGQILALAFLPLTPRVLVLGFVLFRILDIGKPFPARRLESLPGGSGIMADDLMVGLYANVLLQGAAYFLPGFLGME
jgi:phosphatidylglycerophosphatase A